MKVKNDLVVNHNNTHNVLSLRTIGAPRMMLLALKVKKDHVDQSLINLVTAVNMVLHVVSNRMFQARDFTSATSCTPLKRMISQVSLPKTDSPSQTLV